MTEQGPAPLHELLELIVGERIIGRADFAAVQAQYPTSTGQWSFDVHRLVVEGDSVVSEVTVTDGEQSARAVVFSEIDGEHSRA